LTRRYVRNGVRGWTVEAQIKLLDDGGWGGDPSLFQDTLRADRAKKPSYIRAEWLIERDNFLRKTHRRGETLVVATPLALAVSQRDLTKTLIEAAENRGATVLFADSGLAIAPDAGMAGADAAIGAWLDALEKATKKTSKIAGNIAAAAAKRKRTAEKLKVAEPLWPLSTDEISTEEIARRSGLSVKTLYNDLGQRSLAQAKRLRSERRRSRAKN
jgi:hypothetical protein